MTKEKISWKGIWEVLRNSFKGFADDRLPKLAGSLAYCTVFSLGPLLIVIIFLSSIFFGQEAVEGKIYSQLAGFLGSNTARELQDIIRKATISGKGGWAATIGFITLIVGATTVFAEIQDSINVIWGLKPKPKRGWLKFLQNRILSFSLVVSLGFLMIVSLSISAIMDAFGNHLKKVLPDFGVVFFYILNQLLTLTVITLLFAVVFKVLPDAKIRLKDVISGALVTAVLFMLGKFAISFYIGQTSVGSTYGAAGSLVVLLIWTYYSAMILYFGAEFTKYYSIKYGAAIHPNDYAVTMQQVEIETGKKTIAQKEKIKKVQGD